MVFNLYQINKTTFILLFKTKTEILKSVLIEV